MAPGKEIALPGRGLALAWAPDGHTLAVGGHFRERATKLRYDTRIADVASGQLTRSFSCHYWWVVATAWVNNPYVGEVIADGGGDHAVKIWDANGPGSSRCNPGQLLAADGGIEMLPEIGGWTTALEFSPDGRFLAGASRDRTIRIWQIEPGPDQWKVVSAIYAEEGGSIFSVAWSPDGRRLAAGDRSGRTAVWSFDPAADRWDADTIASFERMWFDAQPSWFRHHAAVSIRTPLWTDGGHRTVWNVRFSPDGARVAAAGADGVLSVFDAATGAVAYRTGAPRSSSLHGLDWSPDGRLLTTGAADNYIYAFDAATGGRWDVLEGHADTVTAVAWSPDGATLASTAGGPLFSVPLSEIVTGPDQAVRLWSFR
jgi:WD40 repeat protein